MKQVLKDFQDGTFAKDFLLDMSSAGGQAHFKALRKLASMFGSLNMLDEFMISLLTAQFSTGVLIFLFFKSGKKTEGNNLRLDVPDIEVLMLFILLYIRFIKLPGVT